MARRSAGGKLADRRYVTVIVRLMVDARGRLVQGEIVDATATSHGRFVGWRGLIRTLRAWLASQERVGSESVIKQ